MSPIIQIPSIVLPQVWVIGTETEIIADLVTHPSIDIPTEYLQEKIIHIMAIEAVVAGVPGNLWCWVELSPVASTTSAAYWAAIGGGGGALVPTAPVIEVAAGVNGTVHTILLPWAIHSPFARVIIQTPVAVALPAAFWVVQCIISAKSP